jgi:transcriptional regulator with XRE-family HTH domain
MLAGISAEYYLRLEVGRDKHPSPQVLDALARALRLDAKATQYLQQLVAAPGGNTPDLEARAYALAEVVDEISMPTILANRYQDVLAANPLARALSPGFAPGQNFLRWRLLDPAARELYIDWDDATEMAVAGLRELAGPWPNDARMQAFVAELSSASEHFRELWSRAEVGYRLGIHHMRHPLVGELYLHRHRLNAPYPGGDHMVMYRAERDSDSARALEELRSMSAASVGGTGRK